MANVVVKISSLWHCESSKSVGGEYFRGNLGDCYVLLFHNPSNHPKSPEFDLCVDNRPRTRGPRSYKVGSPPDVEETPSEAPETEWEKDRQESSFPEEEPPDEDVDEDKDVPF